MINPSTYETFAVGLTAKSTSLNNNILAAITRANQELIFNPDNISNVRKVYEKDISKILSGWNKDIKNWADVDLAEAYKIGVDQTDDLLKNKLNVLRNPTGEITSTQIMQGTISKKVRNEVLKSLPEHTKFYNVFKQSFLESIPPARAIIRQTDDLFRKAVEVVGTKQFKETEIFTRRKFSQALLNEIADSGVTHIVYKNGRKVSLEAYTEMVGRTTSGRAAVQGSLNRFTEYNYDLIRVSSHFRACDLCIPHEGKIYSLSGSSSKYPPFSDAILLGLFHPNCAHDVSPFIPNVSPKQELRVDPAEQALIDKHGYKKAQKIAYQAQQKQRYIERNIRKYKKREIASLDENTKNIAHRKMLDWQKVQREHISKNPFLRRDYGREAVKISTDVAVDKVIPSSEATQVAKRLYEAAVKKEPAITKDILDIAKNNNSKTEGLNYRLKSLDSLSRKIQTDHDFLSNATFDEIGDAINDGVRYTMIMPNKTYTNQLMAILQDMHKKGYKLIKFKNFWGGETYKGINSSWVSLTGQRLELQFHTEQSLIIKETKSHKIYEALRETKDRIKIIEYNNQLFSVWKSVKAPDKILSVTKEQIKKLLE